MAPVPSSRRGVPAVSDICREEGSRGRTAIPEKLAECRPPSYPSKSTLAHELDCAESTIDQLVKRSVLPKPIKLSSGCVRWCWADVVAAIGSLKGDGAAPNDPYIAGVQNVAKIER
jgi:predicted DNA-binding transcriptional regulator AlpA